MGYRRWRRRTPQERAEGETDGDDRERREDNGEIHVERPRERQYLLPEHHPHEQEEPAERRHERMPRTRPPREGADEEETEHAAGERPLEHVPHAKDGFVVLPHTHTTASAMPIETSASSTVITRRNTMFARSLAQDGQNRFQ